MNLYPYVLCTRDGEKAQRLAFEDQSCVGRVLHYQEVMLPGKIDYCGEELTRRYGSSGVVRIVQQEDFGARQLLRCEALEIGQVVVLFAQREGIGFTAVPACMGSQDRVARGSHDNGIAGIDETSWQEGQDVFRAHGVVNLRFWIEILRRRRPVPYSVRQLL